MFSSYGAIRTYNRAIPSIIKLATTENSLDHRAPTAICVEGFSTRSVVLLALFSADELPERLPTITSAIKLTMVALVCQCGDKVIRIPNYL